MRTSRSPSFPTLSVAADGLVGVGKRFYGRGWVMGTSGNFSVVLNRAPVRLAITPSGAHKGQLTAAQILSISETGEVSRGVAGRPSAETGLHLEIAKHTGAGAILHTHSIWGTLLSERHAGAGGLAIYGYEMLKGLEGVKTHDHREWLPIIENDQDIPRMSGVVAALLADHPAAHGFLIRHHGLYTWGQTLAEAERHVEILEFLLEVVGREGGSHGRRQHS